MRIRRQVLAGVDCYLHLRCAEEIKRTQSSIEQNRTHALDAAIVRAMKGKKELSYERGPRWGGRRDYANMTKPNGMVAVVSPSQFAPLSLLPPLVDSMVIIRTNGTMSTYSGTGRSREPFRKIRVGGK